MALNPNHSFDELDGIKCSIAEKNCTPERSEFLKKLLEHNGYTVVIAAVPSKPVAKPAPPKDGEVGPTPVVEPEKPALFNVGVTDLTFNPINAVFNRALKTFKNEIVNSDYWKQKTQEVDIDFWYWKHQ